MTGLISENREQKLTRLRKEQKNSKSALTGELGVFESPVGDVSTEKSVTVTDERLNGGKPTNIPMLVKGQDDAAVERILRGTFTDEDIETAVKRANERVKKGQSLPSFSTIEEAVSAAKNRSNRK